MSEGLSRHLDIDPLLIRVIFGALTVFGGAGIVLYLLAWLTIPNEDAHDSVSSRALRQDPERTMAVGLTLAGIAGALTLLGAIGFSTPRPFAVITVSLVALVVFTVLSRRSSHQTSSAGTAYGSSPAPASPEKAASAEAPVDASGRPTDDSATPPMPPMPPMPPVTPQQRAEEVRAWWQRPAASTLPPSVPPGGVVASPYPPVPQPHQPRPKSRLTPITLAVMTLALGGIWSADVAGADIHPSVYPGTVLALTAAALLLGTWYGRAKLLIPIGLISALVTAATTVIGPGPYGERVYEPTTAGAVKDSYEHGAGRIVVNLEDVNDVDNLDGRTVDIDARVGLVQVVVPTSVDAQISSHVEGGDINGPVVTNETGNGSQKSVMRARHDGRPLVEIDVDLKYGQIEILRAECPGLAIAPQGDTASQDLSTMIWNGDDRDPAACH